MEGPADLAIEHLLLRLRPLNRALRRAVERQRQAAARLVRPDAVPLCITDNQVSTLLDDADAFLRDHPIAPPEPPDEEQARQEDELRHRAVSVGVRLPLDALAEDLALSDFEQDALLLCAAPELDRAYERIYAYVLDDLNRRYPCVELLASLTARSTGERLARLRTLGLHGRLQCHGLLVAGEAAPTVLRQELRLGPGVHEFLLTGRGQAEALFRDPDHVSLTDHGKPPPGTDLERLRRLGRALDRGELDVVGVWAPRQAGAEETVLTILSETGRRARRLRLSELPTRPHECRAGIAEALRAASALAAVVWIVTDPLTEPGSESLAESLAEALTACRIPVVLSGLHPWQPTVLLAGRSYAELEIEPPDFSARKTMWADALHELDEERRSDLAARLRLGRGELRAATRVARTRAWLAGNGRPASVADHLEGACAAVIRRRTHTFASVIQPKRGPEDLVLPVELHRQVMEVARFYRAWPRIAETWGFGRLVAGGGIKVLFTGDSGTGKTLAAEVIAGELRVPLVKVDLARVVSKWVGETEKNLAAAFEEAEDSLSVLFFDEADALFGKRGEVQHGTDRYANLEVSYLLQQLEDYGGLVILASNLRDHIDAAFTRRFQVTLHFPRPVEAERRRIWEVSLPSCAPLAPDTDLEALSRLDMTGGSISSATRCAALLAAAENGAGAITMRHLVEGVNRQFQREARLLRMSDLGSYAALLEEPP